VDDEFAFHIETRVDELVAQGLTPAQARDEALRGFGNIHQLKRVCRTLAEERERLMRRTQWWSDWQHDLKFAFRQLKISPVLTAVLVATIALGIGATVSIFSVLGAVLLQPLPYNSSERIVFVYETLRGSRGNASVGHFYDWTGQGTVFEKTAATRPATYNLSDGEPERVSGVRVTGDYFRVMEVPPALGRYFTEQDLQSGSRLVVLSHGLWQRRFGTDPAIIGRTIGLNGEAHAVVGVTPRGFNMTARGPELWTPLVFTPQQRANYGTHAFPVVAKLKPGVTRDAAQADIARVNRDIARREPKNTEGRGVNVVPLHDVILGDFRMPLYVLMTSVVLVLLIGCANVASLLLARAATRRREMAVRAAIGGGRWRIVRQLLTESIVLALVGGVAGVAVAWAGVRLFVMFGPPELPRLQNAGLQQEVLLFALVLTFATGLAFGLAPAFRAARENLLTTLREGGRSSLPGAARDRLRAAVVVAEIAVAVVLLVGAGLFIRSALRLQQVPLGFDPEGVLTARVALPPERYADNDVVSDTYRRILEQARAIPGVRYAGAATGIPPTGTDVDAIMDVEGKTYATVQSAPSPQIRLITDGYVEAIGMPLRRGRTLLPSDTRAGAPQVVLINESLANQVWPGENPIGKRISTWTGPEYKDWREVVGVVGNVRSFGLERPPTSELFIPYTQPPPGAWDNPFQRSMALVVRSDADPAAYAQPLRRAVWAVDSTLPLFAVRTIDEALGLVTDSTRFSTWLLALLAGAGLILATVGIYSVIAYFVTQRTPEIGLRLALGASQRSVLLLVLRHAAGLAIAGILIGLAGALVVTRLVATLLFEVTATDPPTYVLGAIGLLLVALLACAVPASRAVRVNPVRSLAES
jgi:predicted permease